MLDEIRELLRGRIDPRTELDFVALVDLVADRREPAFPGSRYSNELGVAWMSCCSWPGMPEDNKSAEYRTELQEVAQGFRGIAVDTSLQTELISRLTPKALVLQAGESLQSIHDVLYFEEEDFRVTTAAAPPVAY